MARPRETSTDLKPSERAQLPGILAAITEIENMTLPVRSMPDNQTTRRPTMTEIDPQPEYHRAF